MFGISAVKPQLGNIRSGYVAQLRDKHTRFQGGLDSLLSSDDQFERRADEAVSQTDIPVEEPPSITQTCLIAEDSRVMSAHDILIHIDHLNDQSHDTEGLDISKMEPWEIKLYTDSFSQSEKLDKDIEAGDTKTKKKKKSKVELEEEEPQKLHFSPSRVFVFNGNHYYYRSDNNPSYAVTVGESVRFFKALPKAGTEFLKSFWHEPLNRHHYQTALQALHDEALIELKTYEPLKTDKPAFEGVSLTPKGEQFLKEYRLLQTLMARGQYLIETQHPKYSDMAVKWSDIVRKREKLFGSDTFKPPIEFINVLKDRDLITESGWGYDSKVLTLTSHGKDWLMAQAKSLSVVYRDNGYPSIFEQFVTDFQARFEAKPATVEASEPPAVTVSTSLDSLPSETEQKLSAKVAFFVNPSILGMNGWDTFRVMGVLKPAGWRGKREALFIDEMMAQLNGQAITPETRVTSTDDFYKSIVTPLLESGLLEETQHFRWSWERFWQSAYKVSEKGRDAMRSEDLLLSGVLTNEDVRSYIKVGLSRNQAVIQQMKEQVTSLDNEIKRQETKVKTMAERFGRDVNALREQRAKLDTDSKASEEQREGLRLQALSVQEFNKRLTAQRTVLNEKRTFQVILNRRIQEIEASFSRAEHDMQMFEHHLTLAQHNASGDTTHLSDELRQMRDMLAFYGSLAQAKNAHDLGDPQTILHAAGQQASLMHDKLQQEGEAALKALLQDTSAGQASGVLSTEQTAPLTRSTQQ